jgi:hypothetical protein
MEVQGFGGLGGLGLEVWSFGVLRVWGFRVYGLGFRVWVWGLGLRV